MILKDYNDAYIETSAIVTNLTRLTDQIYKLLPTREEGNDWSKPLETIINELAGMSVLLICDHETLFKVLCKLKGLYLYKDEKDFIQYRRVIFECLNLMGKLVKKWQPIL